MDLDILWKAIVPLSFLAIWALTHLINREAKPLPVRLQPQNPYGPRPGPAIPPPRPTAATSPPPIRWAPQGAVRPPPPLPRAGGDDDIVILDSPRPGRGAGSRGVSPGRRARAKPAKPAPTAPRVESSQALTGVSQTVNQQMTVPMSIQPLSVSTSSMPVESVSSAAPQGKDTQADRLRPGEVANILADPRRLREAILISMILQPPPSRSLRTRSHRS